MDWTVNERLLVCNVNSTLSAGCPSVVTITPSTGTFEAGDVLTCSADGYDPTYTWTGITGVNGATVSETGDEYTLPEGPFYVTCTATVSQLSCRDSATVRDNAYSEYQRQHNIVETVLMKKQGFYLKLYCWPIFKKSKKVKAVDLYSVSSTMRYTNTTFTTFTTLDI